MPTKYDHLPTAPSHAPKMLSKPKAEAKPPTHATLVARWTKLKAKAKSSASDAHLSRLEKQGLRLAQLIKQQDEITSKSGALEKDIIKLSDDIAAASKKS
jgi:hypothetical protein